jgi:hypothetical protein
VDRNRPVFIDLTPESRSDWKERSGHALIIRRDGVQ